MIELSARGVQLAGQAAVFAWNAYGGSKSAAWWSDKPDARREADMLGWLAHFSIEERKHQSNQDPAEILWRAAQGHQLFDQVHVWADQSLARQAAFAAFRAVAIGLWHVERARARLAGPEPVVVVAPSRGLYERGFERVDGLGARGGLFEREGDDTPRPPPAPVVPQAVAAIVTEAHLDDEAARGGRPAKRKSA